MAIRLFILTGTLLFVQEVFAIKKSICGPSDDRMPSRYSKIGRVQKVRARSGCTFTLIGRTCGVTAGHCEHSLIEAHFNVPNSDLNGRIRRSDPNSIYKVNKDSIRLRSKGKGADWAVMRLQENEITGQLAGDAQGHYYVQFKRPEVNLKIRITGYGADRDYRELDRNYAQQTHVGKILTYEGGILQHNVDTRSGSSGSAIVLIDGFHRVIGVHTHGGCSDGEGAGHNSGTLLGENNDFEQAVKDCLKWERDNL